MHIRRPLLGVAAATLATGTAAAELPTTDPLLVPEALDRYVDASQSGGPSEDGIPSIDDPRFRDAGEGDDFLEPDDRVIGIYHNGEARAYPQRILVWHEIVNDTIDGENLAITYCPLTGTALGFKRGDAELGVSGRLVNSNLIMFDRDTGSRWPQILGAAIEGPHKGDALEEVRLTWTTWEGWQERHPDTTVLSTRTGYARNYNHDPYGSYTPLGGYYAENAGRIFPVMAEDERYPPKREVYGFRDGNGAVAIDMPTLREAGVLTHSAGESDYLIIHDPGLETAWVYSGASLEAPAPEAVEFTVDGPRHEALDDLEPIPGFSAMWFAWYAFYPETQVIDAVD